MLDAEFLIMRQGSSERAKDIISRIARYGRANPRPDYSGKHEFVFMWGPGGLEQQHIAAAHRAKGGTTIFFDLGYFHRSSTRHKGCIRLTINDPHPQKYLHLAEDNKRFVDMQFKLHNLQDPNGHIVLCGMGEKSRAQYGYVGNKWETDQRDFLLAKYPDRKLYFRPKPKTREIIPGTIDASEGMIIDVLDKAFLAVCHHSNVAIDCALLGVPCVTYDGAGVELWPSSLDAPVKVPELSERANFLAKVCWFNWMPNELGNCFRFIERHVDEIRRIGREHEGTPRLWKTRA